MLKIGGLYFAEVFTAGFVLGTVRVLWVEPWLGARVAELSEAPLMIAVSMVVARWIVHRFRVTAGSGFWLGVGLVALTLMLVVEFSVVLWLRGTAFTEYFANRDPVSSIVYFASLALFAVLPWLLSRSPRNKQVTSV